MYHNPLRLMYALIINVELSVMTCDHAFFVAVHRMTSTLLIKCTAGRIVTLKRGTTQRLLNLPGRPFPMRQ